MKKCKHCQSDIDVKAKVCPNCHKKQGNFFQKHPILIVLLVLVVIGLVAGGNDESNNTEKTSKDLSNNDKTVSTEVTTTKNPEEEKNEFISQCQTIGYKEIARNPDNYNGTKAKFVGKVIQVQEGMLDSVILRVDVTKGEYDIWDDTVYVDYTYAKGESKILEDDIITMYGTLKGSKSYTTVLGATVTIPKFDAKYIELN